MSGIEKIAAGISTMVSREITSFHEVISNHIVSSPIEALFLSAIHSLVKKTSETWFEEVAFLRPSNRHSFDARSAPEDTLIIDSQVKILPDQPKWPVDFTVTPGGCATKIVVECDGHDFHERTKQQASRDRSRDRQLQTAGFTIFRFTGSELYRDPIACALEVLRAAEIQHHKENPIDLGVSK